MDVIGLLIVAGLGWVLWNAGRSSGKREGSRKGYGVGFDRGRRSKNSSGCLVVFLVFGFVLALVI